jgi:uncharacterized protein (UPF0276 family)
VTIDKGERDCTYLVRIAAARVCERHTLGWNQHWTPIRTHAAAVDTGLLAVLNAVYTRHDADAHCTEATTVHTCLYAVLQTVAT